VQQPEQGLEPLVSKIDPKWLYSLRCQIKNFCGQNKIFTQMGIPELKKKEFVNSPFSASWFGTNNLGDYTDERGMLPNYRRVKGSI